MSSVAHSNPAPVIPQALPWTSWAAVIAGTITHLALMVALTELCVGIGLTSFEPVDPASASYHVAAGTAVALLVSGLLSLFIGSWVAGRMKRHGTRTEAAIHGLLVWAVSAILAGVLATVSVGVLAGGVLSLIGKGITGSGEGLAAAVPSVAKVAAPSWDFVKQQVESGFAKIDSAAAAPASENRFAEHSRLLQLLGQTFTLDGHALSGTDRQELNVVIASQLGISAEAARTTVDQWLRVWRESVDRFQAAKEETKRKAIDAATVTKERAAQGAVIAFLVMMAGLSSAIAGAISGSTCVWTRARREAEEQAAQHVVYP